MSKHEKLIEKLFALTIKKSELEILLGHFNFEHTRTRGSHEVWKNRSLQLRLVFATHSKEVKPYQLHETIRVLKQGGLL